MSQADEQGWASLAKTQQLNKLQQICPNFTKETFATIDLLASRVAKAAVQIAEAGTGAAPDQVLEDEFIRKLEQYRKYLSAVPYSAN